MRQVFTITVIIAVLVIQAGIGIALEQVQPDKTVIVLQERFTSSATSSQTVTLGDVCRQLQTSDPNLEQALRRLPLIAMPKAGEEVTISRPAIYQALRAAHIPYYTIQIEGALQTQVYGPGHPYTVQEMITDIQKNILQETGWSEEELILRVLTPPTRDIWIPTEGVEKEINRLNPYVLGSTRYEISFFHNKILFKKVPLILLIQHRRTVYVTAETLNRGSVIQDGDVRELVQLIDNTLYDNQLVDNKEDLIGRQCRIPLKKGSLLRWDNLETNYLTKWGELVQMIVRTQGMLIQTLAIAQQKGAQGEIISVKTQNTGKIVKARIIQKGLVELISS